MGEEEKKPEEGKKEAAAAKGEKKAAPEEAKMEEEKQKKEEGKEKKDGEGVKKEGEEAPPPPPPVEVVMKVHMHCEGCARKVRRSLSGFEGVEAVTVDYRIHRVVVKGQKAAEDPMKVVERVQRKSHRRVELISPIPPPKPEKEEEKEEKPKVEEKKEEPQVIVVQLKVHMHCEACAKETKKRILRMKGVQAVEPDLKSSTVTVTGVFDTARLAAYIHKRTRKHAVVLKQEPAERKPEAAPVKADSAAEAKDEKKADAGEKRDQEEDGDGEKKEDKKKAAEGDGEEVKKEAGGGDGEEKDTGKKKDSGAVTEAAVVAVVATAAVDGGAGKMRRNEFYYYYPRYPVEYAYPPQIFSDENPNACIVM
uniref:Heavy metal-associated isoprenylated plant protein 7 n=1 Tax=Elaeis guineensis var. tenera TaxID=51953 RepID=A0A6I9RIH4_ELAGV|nr:heavy metal-associated isoprenylated plant protein 7 [Elaeis guineensis]